MAEQSSTSGGAALPAHKGSYENHGDMRDMAVPFPSRREQPPTSLHGASLLEILEYLALGGHEGRLQLQQGEIALAVDVRNRKAVTFLVKGWDEDRAITNAILLTKDKSEESKVRLAMVDARSQGKRVARVFFERKLAKLPELVGAIRTGREGLFEELSQKGTGVFAWTPAAGASVAPDAVEVDLRPMIVRLYQSRLRRAFHRDMETFLRPLMGRYPVCDYEAACALPGITLDRKERSLLEAGIDGARTLAEIFSISLLSRHGTARLVYLLSGTGRMTHHVQPQAEVVRVATEEQLRQLLASLKGRNHFDALGLHWTCHPSEVESAIASLRARFGPTSEQYRSSKETAEMCRQISSYHERAYAALCTKAGRRKYRDETLGTARIRYAADFLVTQVELNKFKSDFRQAKRLLDCAQDLVDDPEVEGDTAEKIRKKYSY